VTAAGIQKAPETGPRGRKKKIHKSARGKATDVRPETRGAGSSNRFQKQKSIAHRPGENPGVEKKEEGNARGRCRGREENATAKVSKPEKPMGLEKDRSY